MAIQISDLTANPNAISLPGTINLEYTITAEAGTTVMITYEIYSHIDVVFIQDEQDEAGPDPRQITKLVTLPSQTVGIRDHVSLRQADLQLNFSEMPLVIRAENLLDSSIDINDFQINFY